MDAVTRIERQSWSGSLDRVDHSGGPPLLAAAMRHAVFPRGARIRPRLCLAVAAACGEDDPAAAEGAAAAIEFMHCASLIHDDLPCFDNADTRRGRPSVHRAFGEPLAVLAGDALIVLSFQTIAWGAARCPGAVAGADPDLGERDRHAVRHRRRTGLGMRADDRPWGHISVPRPAPCSPRRPCWGCRRRVRNRRRGGPWASGLGEAYQVADDIADVLSGEAELGKPTGQDQRTGPAKCGTVDGCRRRHAASGGVGGGGGRLNPALPWRRRAERADPE